MYHFLYLQSNLTYKVTLQGFRKVSIISIGRNLQKEGLLWWSSCQGSALPMQGSVGLISGWRVKIPHALWPVK